MLSLGADTTTKEQIYTALGWDASRNYKEIRSLLYEIEIEDRDTKDANLNVANNGWLNKDLMVLKNFQDGMERYFTVNFQREDFSKPETTRDNINQWVADRTDNRITELFPSGSFNSLTKLVMANAVFFKGLWRKPFDDKLTTMSDFQLLDGSNKQVNFMFKNSEFLTGVNRNVEVLEIPYGDEGKFSMLFMKPRNTTNVYEYKSSPNDFTDVNSLCHGMKNDRNVMTGMLESLREEKIDIFVPKFTVEQGFDLKDKLQAMGVQDLFSDATSDLSKISGQRNLYVSSAKHEAFIEVDEAGTEAGAATGFGVAFMSMPLQVRLDRPFLFFILNKRCNTVVFSGKVMDPSM